MSSVVYLVQCKALTILGISLKFDFICFKRLSGRLLAIVLALSFVKGGGLICSVKKIAVSVGIGYELMGIKRVSAYIVNRVGWTCYL
jgi:hypothetical protein